MIRNDVQYRVTKAQAGRFEKALRELRQNPPKRLAKNDELREIYEGGIRSQLDELKEEIEQYEALSSGALPLRLNSFEDLPALLVQGRIAAGLSQKELADRLSMKEQQVQRYESTEYASASFSRLKEVALALGLRVTSPAVIEPVREARPRRASHGIHRTAAKSVKTAARKKASSGRSAARTKTRAAAAKKSIRVAAKNRKK